MMFRREMTTSSANRMVDVLCVVSVEKNFTELKFISTKTYFNRSTYSV